MVDYIVIGSVAVTVIGAVTGGVVKIIQEVRLSQDAAKAAIVAVAKVDEKVDIVHTAMNSKNDALVAKISRLEQVIADRDVADQKAIVAAVVEETKRQMALQAVKVSDVLQRSSEKATDALQKSAEQASSLLRTAVEEAAKPSPPEPMH